MNKCYRIINSSHPEKPSLKVASADNFQSRLRGHFRNLAAIACEGIYFKFPIEGKVFTAIHTLFMKKPLLALWMDQNNNIVDKKITKPWHVYSPDKKSKYLLEISPSEYNFWNVGDKIEVYEIF